MAHKKFKLIIPATLLILFGFMQYFNWFAPLDRMIHDNVLVSERSPSDSIIIVGIDDRSINEIGSWPWPRLFVAEAIYRLTEMGAAAIGVNILYDTVGATPEYDQLLVEVASETDRLVFGAIGVISPFQDDRPMMEIDYYALPFGELGEIANVGFVNVIADAADGVMRRALTSMRFGDITVHSLPLEVYRTFRRSMGQEPVTDIPLDDNGQFPIRFVGGPQTFTAVSLWGVINEHYPPAMFRDAIVLIGPYTAGIGETTFPTSIERGISMHGVELYANIIQNLMESIFVTDAQWWINIVVLAFSGLVILLLYRWLKPVVAFAVTLALAAAIVFGARLAYDHLHVIISVSAAVVFLAVSYLSHLVISTIAAQSDRQNIKNLFGRFVAPEVVNEIINGGVELQLGGVVKEITALFVDIRGFTAFSEANPPEMVVNMVNRYLELTSTAIQKNNGTIDKFIGDATMALFNAPNDVPNHPLHAVKAAWAMKQNAAALTKEIWDEFGVDLQFGIGINTGTAVVGNMGSDFRMDYTAIGDAINTAARLESNAQKGQIIISDATYQSVKDFVDVAELGVISLKNKSVGVLIYSVENVRD